jgi:hypothetical protein
MRPAPTDSTSCEYTIFITVNYYLLITVFVLRVKKYHEPVPGEMKSLIFQRYDLGEVEVRRGLDSCYGTVAMRDARQMPSSVARSEMSIDLYIVFKLLPIATKVHLFCKQLGDDAASNYVRDVLLTSIASDVADELKACSSNPENINAALLSTLSFVCRYDFSAFMTSTALRTDSTTSSVTSVAFGSPGDVAVSISRPTASTMISPAQALTQLAIFICAAANRSPVDAAKEHVHMECLRMVQHFTKAGTSMAQFKSMVAGFVGSQKSWTTGDGTDPYGLKQQGCYFNHWQPKSGVFLDNIDVALPYYDNAAGGGAIIRQRLPQLDEPGEFEKYVRLLAEKPVYRIPEAQRRELYLPYPPNDSEKESKNLFLAEEKTRKSSFGVRGDLFE